mmetsp:Transcript_7349/g.16835  ORF Transcript_7349/g.16835 Transcript_7349/m.16835 type:complete len:102 (+) Transcript_7349:661-966(+)
MAVTLTDFPNFCRFVGICKKNMYQKDKLEGRLRHTFRLMDSQAVGILNHRDLRNYLAKIGLQLTEEQSEQLTDLMSRDDRPLFDEESFVDFMKQQISRSFK